MVYHKCHRGVRMRLICMCENGSANILLFSAISALAMPRHLVTHRRYTLYVCFYVCFSTNDGCMLKQSVPKL